MGTLSHELETLVEHIESGAVDADDRAYELLQASLDELGHMRDAVGAGRRVEAARDLLQRIHALSGAPARRPRARAATAGRLRTEPQSVRPAPVAPVEALAPVPQASDEAPRVERPIPAPTSEAPHFAMRPEIRPAPASPAQLESGDEVEEEEEIAAPIALPPGREPQPAAERQELARVDADLLDTLLNNAGEVSIFRSRLEQQVSSIDFNLGGALAHRHTPQGAAAQARARDRSADPAPPPGRATASRGL